MVGSNLRVPDTDNGNGNGEEISWAVRPGGMVVQMREDDAQEQQGFDGSNLMIKASHGSNLHNITVPSTSTFGDVKRIIAQEIGVEPETQKLFFRGKEKEDNDYLQVAGIKDNAKLLLVEETRAKEINSKEIIETSEISRGSEAVAKIRAEVDKLAEKASALQVVVSNGTKVDEKDIIYITEMLMRQLLELDMVEAAGEGKLQRKMEVRRIQRLVEEMDILKAKNSNPFSEYDNTVSVTTKWENFDSGVGSLTPPNPNPAPPTPTTSATKEWEQFD